MYRALSIIFIVLLLATGTATAQQQLMVDKRMIRVETCQPDKIASGVTYVSSYGTSVMGIDENCEVVSIQSMVGPVNMYKQLDENSGLGIVIGVPMIFENGVQVFSGLDVYYQLEEQIEGEKTHFHHEFTETEWGTYMSILAVQNEDGVWDDLIIEFNTDSEILKIVSLNELLLGGTWAADCLGGRCEDWLHTNAIDTLTPNRVLVSPRNLDVIVELDWDTLDIIHDNIGEGELNQQHHPSYIDNGERIIVYDNNFPDGNTEIYVFGLNDDSMERYELPFYAPSLGSVQLLSNGNWLTVDGNQGVIYEFSPDFSEIYMKIQHNQANWIGWMGRYSRAVYRANKVESS